MLIAYHSPPEHRLFQINDFCSLRDFWICISKFKNSGFPSLLLCSHLHGLLRSRRDGHEPNTLNQSWDSPLMVICFLLDKHKFSEIPFQKSSLQTVFLPIFLSSKQVSQSDTGEEISTKSSTESRAEISVAFITAASVSFSSIKRVIIYYVYSIITV